MGIAVGETDNPRKTVPSAIRKTFYRILFFFVLTVFFIGILIPYDNEDLLGEETNATASPFVIAANLAGVSVLPGLINAVLLTVVLSAANSNVYSGSRILVGLAQAGLAPRLLTRTTKGGESTSNFCPFVIALKVLSNVSQAFHTWQSHSLLPSACWAS